MYLTSHGHAFIPLNVVCDRKKGDQCTLKGDSFYIPCKVASGLISRRS